MASDRRTGSISTKAAAGWPVWLRWTLVAVWMAVIFRASATPDLKTVPLAQRVHLLPLVLGPQATDLLELVLRKGAHIFSFGLLAVLARFGFAGSLPAWSRRRLTAAAFALTLLYAVSDEWHQTFVPGREGRLRDVIIDLTGAAIALWLFRRRQRTSRVGD